MTEDNPEKINLGKIVALLTIAAIMLGFNWWVWTSNMVPENIPPKTIAQSLLSTLSIVFLLGIIIVVKKKWV